MDKLEKHKEILFLMSLGHTAVEIGLKLGLSPRTVEKTKEILQAAHGAKNSCHLIGIAFRNGLIK